MLTALGLGCAAHSARIEHASGREARPDCMTDSKVCSQPWLGAKPARRDVVTWREYYTSVMDEAFRRNSTVIWINPPRPIANVALAQGTVAPAGVGH
jgi:hypothetical protein